MDSGGGTQPFHLRDDTGSLLIRPNGAKMEIHQTLSHHCAPSDPMYYGKGPRRAIRNSTHDRHFKEMALRPNDRAYVLGPARLQEKVAKPVIEDDERERYYFISTKSEQQIIKGRGILSGFLLFFAFAAALAVPMTFWGMTERLEPAETLLVHPISVVLAGLVFWMAWGILYLMLLYNGLVRVRNRLKRALSLIDIQLKRRHDLIPRLVECVKGAASHEREVQEAVAEARTTAANWGESMGDRDGTLRSERRMVGRLIALAEAYPDLTADENFQLFFHQLTDTEDRIALARHYHNDSLLALQDRLKTFPDVLVAKLFRFKPGNRLPSLQDADKLARAPSISLDEEEQIKPDA